MPQESAATRHAPYLTPLGRERLVQRIADARAAYRSVCSGNGDAAEAGDSSVWHDNFAYEENQRQMHQLARRVRDLEEMLQSARIVQPRRVVPEHVMLGSTVRLRRLEDGRESTWFIAGFEDGEPTEGRISYTAPLARALMGAESGDVRVVLEGGHRMEVEVVELGPAPPSELG